MGGPEWDQKRENARKLLEERREALWPPSPILSVRATQVLGEKIIPHLDKFLFKVHNWEWAEEVEFRRFTMGLGI